MTKHITTADFIKKAIEKHGNKYDYSAVVYENSEKPVKIWCNNCKEYFYQTPSNHTAKNKPRGCPKCANYRRHLNRLCSLEEFIAKSKRKHGQKYNYDSVKYINNYTKVKIFCEKCKKYFTQLPSNHVYGQGCPYCANNQKLTTEIFIKAAKKVHKDKYDYSKVNYTRSSNKVLIICKKCGKAFEQDPNHHLHGSGCPNCICSKGEEYIKCFLDENNVKYYQQYRFKGCKDKKPLPFDFYLPDYNICIEYQGQQHYIPTSFSKNTLPSLKDLFYTKKHDKIKKKFCKLNNIQLITIKYTQNIKNILKKVIRKQ